MPQQQINDAEFGAVTIKRSALARSVKLSISPRGGLSISMPPRTPLLFARTLLNTARNEIRTNLGQMTQDQVVLQHGDRIGKSHTLLIARGDELQSRLAGVMLHVTLTRELAIDDLAAQQFIKTAALKALRAQAKAYLTRRLTGLATEHNFSFTTIRFSNAGTRWGSCSSNGTISLNIWLMQLPFELIDYVLVHELCHTTQMNHSPQFWANVEGILPNYRELRRALKEQRPYM